MLPFVKNFSCNLNMTVFAKGIKQKAKILATGLGLDKGLDVVKGPNGLAGEARGDQAANEGKKCGSGGSEVEVVHFNDELPSDVILTDLGKDVDEQVEGGRGERRVGKGLGILEEGKSNFGIIGEAEEGVVDKLGGESNTMELERGFHGVEGIMVVDKDFRYQFSIISVLCVAIWVIKGGE